MISLVVMIHKHYKHTVIVFFTIFLLGCGSREKTIEIPQNGPPGMVWVPGGEFTMGAIEGDEQARRDEFPAHPVAVDGFWMDATEVTNSQFKEFVDATGYITVAEKDIDW
jgi:sulfatase modifying factor 1